MMKKLLTLILVLGFGSMASAGFTLSKGQQVDFQIDPVNGITLLSLDGSATPVMVFVSPAGIPWTYEYHQFGDLNRFDDTIGNVPGSDLGIDDFSEVAAYSITIASSQKGFLQPGPYWTARFNVEGVTYKAERPADPSQLIGRIDVADFDTMEILATAYVVPEPATMLLLGLGGLFLRRK